MPVPSLINLMVSVDVNHHVYLLTDSVCNSSVKFNMPASSLISLMVSVDVGPRKAFFLVQRNVENQPNYESLVHNMTFKSNKLSLP